MNDSTVIPKHIGIILDGNRRWAKARGLSVSKGHLEGYKTLKTVADLAFDRGVSYLSAYIFSTENWRRARTEVGFLMDLALKMVVEDLKELQEKNIKLVWLGSAEKVSKKLVKALKDAEQATKNNTKGTLAICFNYGGQQEIADAAMAITGRGERITPELIEQNLYGSDVPPIDLVIRTSGEHRISNFMLWRAAYSELYFTDTLWPDFDETNLDEALADFAVRSRRFGG